eukprot:COSAG01_NODE_56307_length_319_cov_0.840909_1_plen_94_part_10
MLAISQQLIGDAAPVQLKLTNTDLPQLYDLAQKWNVKLESQKDPTIQKDLDRRMKDLNDPAIVPGKYTAEAYMKRMGGETYYRAVLVEALMTSN